ncbi:arginase family protein [Clostridium aminobutyricum]|uniref:Arginase family protein n=1 Tax=Clostridium aminobutyricum TaxID=33953 RepID=A0A939D808_CLOAM|nr:arginase family protein [Clostridium aminobutyricum]MBN7772777.1 arginase family protein [Clostridium aminobutyricum]
MKTKHMNLFFPQWQGAGRSKEILKGALEIKDNYLQNYDFFEVPVDEEEIDEITNNILGYKKILRQSKQANLLIAKKEPDSIFTIGGGCDIEIVPVSYLNDKLQGDLTVLWIDAHGDLNTPESSPSKNFHGMPLRTLLGDGEHKISATMFSTLLPSQVILIGQRDLDDPEREYIKEFEIDLISIEEIHSSVDRVIQAVRLKGSNNIYIHIDLDVLDNEEFPYVMVPVPNGLKGQLLLDLLTQLKESFNLVGLSLLEYTSSDEINNKILSYIIRMGVQL